MISGYNAFVRGESACISGKYSIYFMYIHKKEPAMMRTTRVFKCGNSLAVRLPKDLQFDVEEVEIFRRGDELVIRKIPENLSVAFDLLSEMPEDFMEGGRNDEPPQSREFK
jgi:antitoxin VapB